MQIDETGKINNAISENNDNFVKNNENEQRNKISERVPQGEHGESDEVHSRIEEVSVFIRRCIETTREEQQGLLSRHEQEDVEKRAAFDYAKENGLWIDDLYSLGIPLLGGGNENTLAYDAKNNTIYKSNNLFNSQNSVSFLLNAIRYHNQLFQNTKYELIGFTGFDNGANRAPYIEVILCQDYIPNAEQATRQEIAGYMQSLKFNQINLHTFSNDWYIVSDLHPRNVLKNKSGDIFVVDNIIKENEV